MTTWAELNSSVGASVPKPTTPAQSGGWASVNAQARAALAKPAPAPTQAAQPPQRSMLRIDRPTIDRNAPIAPFGTLSAPAAKNSRFGLEGVYFNKPSSGLPLIDVDSRLKVTTNDQSNFVQRGVAAVANTLIQTGGAITESLGNLFDLMVVNQVAKDRNISLSKTGVPVMEDGTPVLLPEARERLVAGRPAQPTTAEKIGGVASVVASVAGASFSPISAQLAAAQELPVVGGGFRLVNKGFELLDHSSRFVGRNVLNALPISDDSKAVLQRPIEDLAGIVGTLFGVKAIHSAGAKGGGRVVDSLPLSEGAKGRIRGGVQLGANVALDPFGTAYRGVIGTIQRKVSERAETGEEITPDVAKTIVNQTVKEVKTPEVLAIMEVPTREGKTQVYTNQKLILENLIRGREDLNYVRVDDLGISIKTNEPITSRFEWDYEKQRGTIYTTSKTTAVDLAHELGHYVDRQLGAGLSVRLSDVIPEYSQNRDQINQMLADYALDRLGGNATYPEINAEIIKIADNIRQEISVTRAADERARPAKQFAASVGDIINDPLRREQSPELAQLIQFSLGNDVLRKGSNPDLIGKPGSNDEAASILASLEGSKKSIIKDTRANDQTFAEQRLSEQLRKQAVAERGALASADYNWDSIAKAFRDSSVFKKEGTLDDRTMDGVLMEKNGKYRVVPFSDVRAQQKNGWESRVSIDKIASANGFERSQDYAEYVMSLDKENRQIPRTSEERAAHDYLIKNDPNYAKLDETINILRQQIKGAETAILGEGAGSTTDSGAVPTQEPQKVAEALKTPQVETKPSETPVNAEPLTQIPQEAKKGVSKVGQSVARKAIEQKLEDSFTDVAGYDKITVKDQAQKAADIVFNDIERARRIVTGAEALPDGLRAGMLIKTLEEYAMKTGDPELAFELANSQLVSETSIHAQELRLLAERSPDSATARLNQIKKIRREEANKNVKLGQTIDDAIRESLKELKGEVKKSRPKKEDWTSFVDSIKCT